MAGARVAHVLLWERVAHCDITKHKVLYKVNLVQYIKQHKVKL